MTRILMTRHAETRNNVLNIAQSAQDADITAHGASQITSLKGVLEGIAITHIYCSDSPRCIQTLNGLGVAAPITFTSLLREKESGAFAGKRNQDIDWDAIGPFETRKAPGGESLTDVLARARTIMKTITRDARANDCILVVTHGAFAKVLLGDIQNMTLRESIFGIKIDHCSITEIQLNAGRPEIMYINKTDHLSP